MSRTRDRILSVSLELFNEESDTDHSAVDIANALDISPGNLYYHFKGKDAIIAELFSQFEEEILVILTGSVGNVRSVEDLWVYNYIVLEEIYDFRFFYRNLDTMLQRYPSLKRRFQMVLKRKAETISSILQGLEQSGILSVDVRLQPVLERQLLSTLTFWLNAHAIQQTEGEETSPGILIHQTVFQMMALVVPYMGELGFSALNEMDRYYQDRMAGI